MTKGYIEIDIPESCVDCRFVLTGCQRTCTVEDKKVSKYQAKPDWCPIKEHELWKCAKKHKEEMLEFHERQRVDNDKCT